MVLEDKYFRGFETYAWCVRHICLQSDSNMVQASDPLTVLSTVPGSPLLVSGGVSPDRVTQLTSGEIAMPTMQMAMKTTWLPSFMKTNIHPPMMPRYGTHLRLLRWYDDLSVLLRRMPSGLSASSLCSALSVGRRWSCCSSSLLSRGTGIMPGRSRRDALAAGGRDGDRRTEPGPR
jgi:hypothetical protein